MLASGHLLGGLAVEVGGLLLQLLRPPPHRVEPERLGQPDRLPAHEAAHVLAPDQRDVLAEPLAEQLDQHPAMAALLLGHGVEHLGRGRVGVAQPFGEIAVDPPVLLLERDRQRQDLALAELGKPLLRVEAEAEHWGSPIRGEISGTVLGNALPPGNRAKAGSRERPCDLVGRLQRSAQPHLVNSSFIAVAPWCT